MNPIKIIDTKSLLEIVQTPDFQRVVDEEHTKKLYDNMLADLNAGKDIFTNVIHIAYTKGVHDPIIIDGQHRLCAFRRLLLENKHNQQIPVWIHNHLDSAQNFELFGKLNTYKSVLLYNNEDNQKEMKKLHAYLKETYAPFIKTTDSPRGLNFNLDKLMAEFRDEISGCGTTNKNICEAFKKLNTMIEAIPISNMTWLTPGVLSEFKKDNGRKRPNFAMIKDTKLLVQTILCILNGQQVDIVKMFEPLHNTKQQRSNVWKTHCGDSLTGACYCCSEKLEFNNFHMSHVVAKAIGGTDDSSNLRPCCATCNLSMGIENLYTYKKKLKL